MNSKLTYLIENLWALVIPIDATEIGFGNHCLGYKTKMQPPDDTNGFTHAKDPQYLFCIKDYRVIGIIDLMNVDFDVRNFTPMNELVFNNGSSYEVYRDHVNDGLTICPEYSFRSLLKTKGINPTKKTKILIIEKYSYEK